ncbi:hypothetical protein HYV49_04225 [Candidatus Pacearchaeota archaeon]|nr:hypothetical protein [Candidatus Pacearchaeota archaeon]
MEFKIIALKFFSEQVSGLDEKTKRIISDKIRLIKQNPFRYKKVHSRKYSRVFSVRLSIGRSATRMIYAILGRKLVMVCLLDRKKGYKDLEKYLENIRKELGL